jgi:AcrR family transcriptional regulator
MPYESAKIDVLGEPAAPPRERILKAARELFYRQGLRAVGVEAVAEAAGTNKTTLYRHFASKDELIAECLREFGRELDAVWAEVALAHEGEPRDQLLGWLRAMAEYKANGTDRGCALANAAVELPDADHPVRRVIEDLKDRQRRRLVELCQRAGLRDPELLADELFLLGEGARVALQTLGPRGPVQHLAEMFETLVAAHTPAPR